LGPELGVKDVGLGATDNDLVGVAPGDTNKFSVFPNTDFYQFANWHLARIMPMFHRPLSCRVRTPIKAQIRARAKGGPSADTVYYY
jgi:hypothetical protein